MTDKEKEFLQRWLQDYWRDAIDAKKKTQWSYRLLRLK
jgi:hypothetical protein